MVCELDGPFPILNTSVIEIQNNSNEDYRVAGSYIVLIDVNDLRPSDTPPDNPKEGQLWLDSSVNPPVLRVYKDGELIVLNGTEIDIEESYPYQVVQLACFYYKSFNDTHLESKTQGDRSVTLAKDIPDYIKKMLPRYVKPF